MKKNLTLLMMVMLAGCAAPERAAPPPPAPLPPPPPVREPEVYTGLQASQLRTLIGAPAFTRKDGATDMWRYDTPSCRAFFFLTGTPPEVQHVETLPAAKDKGPDQSCLNALRPKRP